MAQPVSAPMPPGMTIGPSYVVRVNALDPTTGAEVTGVTVTSFAILCENIVGGDLAQPGFTVTNPILIRQQ